MQGSLGLKYTTVFDSLLLFAVTVFCPSVDESWASFVIYTSNSIGVPKPVYFQNTTFRTETRFQIKKASFYILINDVNVFLWNSMHASLDQESDCGPF